jgi:GntR family transcriptional regulator
MVVSVPLDFAPPKYAVIVNTVQARIGDGTYPPGSLLPSETALMQEFGVSRPTVVRAFEFLRQHGWIDTQQGKGRFARAAPEEPRGMPEHAAALLTAEVEGRVRMVDAAEIPAPARAAAALDVEPGTPLMVRRWLVTADGVGPVELATAYVPVDLAEGTGVGSPDPLGAGLLQHLTARRGVQFDHAAQRISARVATAEESRLLEVGRRECLLTALITVYDRAGRPALALDVVLPPSRRELEDTFPITL